MNINMGPIMNKAKAWSKTAEGQRRMNAVIERYRKDGRGETAAGSKLITEDMMFEAASKFIQVLRARANEAGLPESVKTHFNSLASSSPVKQPDGSYTIYVYFEDDLHRDSLDNGEGGYTGDGIENIVALFNNGAHAKNYVYGWWEGHSPTGESVYRSGGSKEQYAWVRSKKDREPMRFIQQAISDFNGNYGHDYGVTAVAGDIYE